ncbi:uncharacterized protein FSUBG_640 [Fusarium subglutinans]|uniref:Uncharacterized protein n=1 Tax=Gibberella subglutinans TaxID=42677 RepID=A0A8H5QFA6_GIBSU|nr:uncharacterized protein FSUBG_640 [Fusarium subglutinans]KAF5613432.1 hypothetical protein FSUBG_640 [Fusarium subglutinans]
MPPYAAELETWWLGIGYEALKQLVNDESDDLNSRQCGFAQQMQTRLLAFDNDQTIQASLQTTWPAIRAARGVDYDANSRKNSKYIASNIFRKPPDGGIDFERAMDGLGYLDAIEIRRLRLLEATHAAMETISPTESQLQMLQELDRTSTANFRLLHAGFRACILIEELTRDSECRKEIPQIMGMFNALVPSDVFLEDEDDVDPTPHSPGLRDSVRFSVFEHLMSDHPFSPQQQEVIKMKLSGWCEVPGYPQARDAMVRYCEEFKKIEANATQGASAIFTTATSNDNQDSAPTTPLSPWVLSTSHPLLKGMPGREMSPAKTDGALFSQDLSAPPVLSYPDNLSKTEFFQHPFTRKLDMSPYDPDSDDEGSDMPPVPPLPHIPERLKAHLTPSVLDKIKKRMRYQSDKSERTDQSVVPSQALDQHVGTSTTRKSSDRKRWPSLKANISEPISIIGLFPGSLGFETNSYEAPNIFSSPLQSPKSPPRQITMGGSTLRPFHRRGRSIGLSCQLTKPRLSPMEYCRMYLMEKHLSDCEDRPCELPPPYKHWFWTNHYKQFLVIPQIPKGIRRDLEPMAFGFNVESTAADGYAADSDGESVSTVRPETYANGPMRLSLHLGGEPIILPSFMDTLRFNISNAQARKASELDKEAGDGGEGAEPGDKDMVVPRRVPAGGEVEDWRPMSEYEPDENDKIASAGTPIGPSGDNDSTEDLDKTKKGTGTAAHFAYFDDAITLQDQRTPCLPDAGTPFTCESVRENDLIGHPDQADRQVYNNTGSFRLSRQLSRICKDEMSVFDFATPRPRGKTVGCTPQPLATTDTQSPLARFPIAVQPTHRLTPGTLTKRVVGDSGGKILFEDTRQARLIPSPGDKYHQGLSADLWEADTESIISELQPSPLHINRRKHRATTDESDRRCPRLFDRGYADPPTTLEMLRISAPPERNDPFDRFGDEDDALTEGDRTPRGLGQQEQGLLQATPAPRGLQRSASTIVTPTQSMKRLEHKASFNLEAMAQSGFTPEHRRESISKDTFPGSGIMLNLQSTQERLKCPPQDSDGIEMSTRITEKIPKARRLPDLPDSGRHERAFAPKEWMRALATTPRKSRTMPRNDGRIETHGEASSGVNWRKTLFQPSATMDDGDVERSTLAITRDFSQPQKLQKPASRARLTPSSTYRPSNQQLDQSTRTSSLMPPGSEADVPERRTPSPTASQTTVVPRTPSSSISSIFRKRIRSDYNPPATPRTPAEPTLAWSPFVNCEPEPPCASPWVSGNGEGKREKEKRAAYFRDKVEREFQNRQSPKRYSRKDSLESAANGDSVQNNVATDNRTSKESLIQWKQFLEDAPEPLFSSPTPPVPPLPSESQLNIALDRPPRQTQTTTEATARVEKIPAAAYRDKKPQGLTVETRKLRKAMREGAQTPSRNKSTTPASGSSFRSTFRLEGRRMSFGRPAADHESQGKGRETETFPRCK